MKTARLSVELSKIYTITVEVEDDEGVCEALDYAYELQTSEISESGKLSSVDIANIDFDDWEMQSD